jgi:putative transposase
VVGDRGVSACAYGAQRASVLGRAHDGRGDLYRYRCGIAWRDLPEVFGPWQTVWKWHRRMATDGTWDQVLSAVIAQADAEGLVDWSLSVDSTIARAHQHATNLTRHTGGFIELQESAAGAELPESHRAA